jgi:hypothetical protein
MVPIATFIESLLLLWKTISDFLPRGAKTSAEKLNQAVHFDGVVYQNHPNQRNQFYIANFPVCDIDALKRAILKF